MIFIYEIKNRINEKVYIGQTVNFNKRMKEHIYGRNARQNSVIDMAILKYGKGNFDFTIIDKAVNQIDADEKERYYIKHFNTLCPNGYNVLIGGRNQ